MAPYFDGSFLRARRPSRLSCGPAPSVPDLRGHWYLGVYNNESSNVAYTIRAVLPNTNGLLLSAQPQQIQHAAEPAARSVAELELRRGRALYRPIHGQHRDADLWTNIGFVVATTPLTTFEVLPVPSGRAYYRVVQVYRPSRGSISSSGRRTRCGSPGPPLSRATLCNQAGPLRHLGQRGPRRDGGGE